MQRTLISAVIGILALIMGLFHLYGGGLQLFPALLQRTIHLGLGMSLVFLIYPPIKKKKTDDLGYENKFSLLLNGFLAALSLIICGYIAINHLDFYLVLMSPSALIIVIGVILIILTLEITRRMLGWALPIIAIVFLLYAFIGEKLPLSIQHSGYTFERIITQIGLSSEGIFGAPLGISATYVVLFILFGSFLEKSGAGSLFMDLAMAMVGRFRGGAAKVSVVGSALFGSISGSQVANVVTTGVMTIPLMKRSGYKARFSGAVEAVASTGGMVLPPVMGAVAFLIADFLQIPYSKVALAALIPAILYFVAIFIIVDLRAAKIGLKKEVKDNQSITVKSLLKLKGHLIIPLVLLIFLLMVIQITATAAVFWSILTVPIVSWFRKETRMSMTIISKAIQDGARLSLVILAACATAGIIIGVMDMTGLGLRFSSILLELSGNNVFILCVLTMIASIILGMGLPPVACYLILAILGAPALTDLGVSPLAAHLFIFYFGTLSAITPPVALAAFAAAGIAKSSPMKVALTTTRLGLIAFIIPYMFVFTPALLLDGSVTDIIITTLTALIAVTAIAIASEGYFKKNLKIISRFILFGSAILLITPSPLLGLVGLILIIVTLFLEVSMNKLPFISKKYVIHSRDEKVK